MKNEYKIIISVHKEGQIEKNLPRKEVRNECERLRKVFANRLFTNQIRIEVANNETGEIREYWNNSNNEIKF